MRERMHWPKSAVGDTGVLGGAMCPLWYAGVSTGLSGCSVRLGGGGPPADGGNSATGTSTICVAVGVHALQTKAIHAACLTLGC